MKKPVLDASALLAFLFNEHGAEIVEKELSQGALITTVNFCEVLSKLEERGVPVNDACEHFLSRGLLYALEIVDFDIEQAKEAARLRTRTRSLGLSLGDRACLALASLTGSTAITADVSWKDIEGIDVKNIR
jgi:PIN domain nuclease of toxin-antitoxin system